MVILDYITNNYILIIELIGLLLLLSISVYVQKRTIRFTRIAVILIFLSSLLITVESKISYIDGTWGIVNIWRPLLTTAVYILQPLIIIIIMQITTQLKKKYLLLLLIPVAVCSLIYATSQLTHIIFYFNEPNDYHGGPLSLLPYFVFALYVIAFIIRSIVYFKNFPMRDKISVLYIVLTAVGGVLLFLVRDVTNDYSEIFAYAIIMYYLLLYIEMAKIDTLTGLMNRQCYYRDLTYLRNRVCAVVSVDMNDLKWWNDTSGHEAGDKALITISKCLSAGSGSQKQVYRIGGDEFIIFYFKVNQEFVLNDVIKMRAALDKTPYICAFGYTQVNNNGTLEDEILIADKLMYEDKAKLKQSILDRGGQMHVRNDD